MCFFSSFLRWPMLYVMVIFISSSNVPAQTFIIHRMTFSTGKNYNSTEVAKANDAAIGKLCRGRLHDSWMENFNAFEFLEIPDGTAWCRWRLRTWKSTEPEGIVDMLRLISVFFVGDLLPRLNNLTQGKHTVAYPLSCFHRCVDMTPAARKSCRAIYCLLCWPHTNYALHYLTSEILYQVALDTGLSFNKKKICNTNHFLIQSCDWDSDFPWNENWKSLTWHFYFNRLICNTWIGFF